MIKVFEITAKSSIKTKKTAHFYSFIVSLDNLGEFVVSIDNSR